MSKRGVSIWDLLAWIALGSIVVWALLKIFGVINTPSFIEYYPILAASYVFGWQMHKLENVAREVEGLKKFSGETIKEIHNIKTNCLVNHGK